MSEITEETNCFGSQNRYHSIRRLGGHGVRGTFLAKDTLSDTDVVVKLFPRGKAIRSNMERDLIKYWNLLHHHIVFLQDMFLTRESLAVVMEYIPGEDLFNFCRARGRLPEDLARFIFQQLIVALDYCHRMGVPFNVRMRPKGILLDRRLWPIVKISTLRHSGYPTDEAISSGEIGVWEIVHHCAPEVAQLLLRPRSSKYDGVKADIWSCGVVLYFMLLGRFPFHQADPFTVTIPRIERVLNADYVIPEASMSAACESLIRRMLSVDPDSRPSIEEIQHDDWFRTYLPDGALDMNRELRRPSHVQSDEEIQELIARARLVDV